jgi:hypothetical protein
MPLETASELLEFFDTDDSAIVAHITGPNGFAVSFPVIVDDDTQDVPLYETNVDVPKVTFLARDLDVARVRAGMVVNFPDVAADDPLHARLRGKTFEVMRRPVSAEPGTSRVFLNE